LRSASGGPVVLSARLKEAWQVTEADAENPSGLLAMRLGQVRRHASVVSVPASLQVVLPASASAVEFYLAPPLAPAGKDCRVAVTSAWLPNAQSRKLTLVPQDAATTAWQPVQLDRPHRGSPSELRMVLEPSPECTGAPLVAVSEVRVRVAAPAMARANVVLVVFDTLRRDALDCTGNRAAVTPELSRYACDRGVVFDEAITSAPWTYPALASMHTGLAPAAHRGEGADRNQHDIDRAVPTLAELLRTTGYDTHAVVANWQASRGLWRGFDGFVEMFPPLGRGFVEERRADRVVDEAIAALHNELREPFFLWTLFIDLHEPVDAALKAQGTPETCAGIRDLPLRWQGLERLPAVLDTKAQARLSCRRALYDASLRFADRQFGRLMRELEVSGLGPRTAVIVASDHGEEMGEHRAQQLADGERSRDVWGVGHGHTLYEELVRVPLIVIPPGRLTGSAVSEHRTDVVAVTDLFATALGFAGISPPAGRTSFDLMRARRVPARVVSGSVAYGPERWAVTTAELKAIWTAPATLRVFDRLRDPHEQAPLGVQDPRVNEAALLLGAARAHSAGDRCGGEVDGTFEQFGMTQE